MTIETSKRLVPGTMTIEEFLEFLEFRPEEEKWELIEGYPVMMAPATNAHQRIGYNLCRFLNDALERERLDLQALVDTGVRNAALDTFLPVPDVVVVPGVAGEAVYRDDYCLAAEVLSPSNTRRLIDLKLERYKQAADCRYILIIESKRIGADIYRRGAGWKLEGCREPGAVIDIEEFGFRCSIGDFYRRTHLDPSRS